VRAVVADSVERIVRQVGHALGPGPLAFDEEHARRVADLELYVRQHHAEADLARLGRAVVTAEQQHRAAP
jgi:heme oxygenase